MFASHKVYFTECINMIINMHWQMLWPHLILLHVVHAGVEHWAQICQMEYCQSAECCVYHIHPKLLQGTRKTILYSTWWLLLIGMNPYSPSSFPAAHDKCWTGINPGSRWKQLAWLWPLVNKIHIIIVILQTWEKFWSSHLTQEGKRKSIISIFMHSWKAVNLQGPSR